MVPQRTRLIRLRAEKGTEFTSCEFRQYCLDIGVKLEFASPNTSQQIGSNQRAGRTIAGIVRCLLADSGLPYFLWGELMQTAVYLSNRAPHASLADERPYIALYGKDANLGQPSSDRGEGVRACANPHQETGTPCLGRTPCRLQYGPQVFADLQCIDKELSLIHI